MFDEFCCIICGARNGVHPAGALHRELVPCAQCGSNARFRAIIAGLSQGLHGTMTPMANWQPDKSVRGFGCSDTPVYAERLAELYDYTNTFLDTEPRVDIGDAADLEKFSPSRFILCSDVLEHVLCHPAVALANLYDCLEAGGCLVLSAPTYSMAGSVEKYPSLRSYQVVPIAGRHAVVYQTMTGQLGFDPEPVFHGGPGSVLEMRIFGHTALLKMIRDAGFSQISVIDGQARHYGAVWPAMIERNDTPFPMDGRVIVAVK